MKQEIRDGAIVAAIMIGSILFAERVLDPAITKASSFIKRKKAEMKAKKESKKDDSKDSNSEKKSE